MKSLVSLLMLATAGLAGGEVRYGLFPVGGVFFPKEDGPSRIDADFRKAIEPLEQVRYFETAFRQRFPAAADTISEANYRRTFAVSLQIARASRYTVDKRHINGTVDLYAPVTASIYFSNIATGEVLYANTRTSFKTVSVMPEKAASGGHIVELFKESYRDVVDDLVGDAAKHFNPVTISATVKARWKNLVILDSGSAQGLVPGDTLEDEVGNLLPVISSGTSYAVAGPPNGTFPTGQRFSKVTNGALAEINKPRVLPLVVRAPDGFAKEALLQIFSDALGAKAAISLIPVNRTFAAVIGAVKAQSKLSKELSKREWPKFFVRLSVVEPLSYERSTNLEYKTLRVTQALAYAELIDEASHVLYAAYGIDRTEDEITSAMAFDLTSRKETSVKNALGELAKKFAAELRLEPAKLDVAQGGKSPSVRDDHGIVPPGSSAIIYRNVGKFPGIPTEVLVPTWEVNEVGWEGGLLQLVTGQSLVPDAPLPEKGDVLIMDGVKTLVAQRGRFGPCGTVERLGAVELQQYADLAINLFASSHPAPFYSVGTTALLNDLVRGSTGFREDLKLREPKIEYCIHLAYRIDTVAQRCSDKGCAQGANFKLTFRVREGGPEGAIKLRKISETRITGSVLPPETPEPVRRISLQMDLLEPLLQLAPAVAKQVAQQKL